MGGPQEPNWNLKVLICHFCGGRKTRKAGVKPPKQGQVPTTNSNHIKLSITDHIGERRVLSPLHHLFSPNTMKAMDFKTCLTIAFLLLSTIINMRTNENQWIIANRETNS